MGHQFANASGTRLLTEVGSIFKSKPIFQNKSRHVIFVCGGQLNGPMPTMRSSFLNWAPGALPDCLFILAETAFKEALFHDPPVFINLSKFEQLVAQISDCVLIFPESAGSFAEIGYFSNVNTVRQKVLVANDLSHQAAESFTNLGPIDTLNRKSFLQPAIYISTTGPAIDFYPVKERLARLRDRARRKRLDYKSYADFDYGEKFSLLLQVLIIFRALTLDGLRRSLIEAFGRIRSTDLHDLKILLSTLVASGYAIRRDEYFLAAAGATPLLEIEDVNLGDLLARSTYYHKRYDEQAYKLVSGIYM